MLACKKTKSVYTFEHTNIHYFKYFNLILKPTSKRMNTEQKKSSPEIRLNKAIADAGFCSRRKADVLIKQGCVSVNNSIVSNLGQKVVIGRDIVCVNDVQLKYEKMHTYVMLNKPVQVMSTTNDPENRTTVIDLLPQNLQHLRLFPVGRLDYFSEGLILLTNDGDLANKLIHPRHHLPKVYTVLIRENITEQMLKTMQKGMTLAEGDILAPVHVKILRTAPQGMLIEMTLFQGVNRQIRRMCRDLNLTILKIYRTKLGPLSLDYLEKGATRLLTKEEVTKLKQLA